MTFLILVVDDSISARQHLTLLLEQSEKDYTDMKIDSAEDGTTALEKAQAKDYDLIFLDVEMPGVNGFEVCQRLRALSKRSRIVMLTSNAGREDFQRGRIAGCNSYLLKPARENDVRSALLLAHLKRES